MTATKTGGARHCFFVFPNVSIIAHPARGGVCGGEELLLFFIFRIFKKYF